MNGMGEVLAAHAPRTQPPMGLVVGCSCGWRIGRTMYEGYDTHVEAALVAAGFGDTGQAARDALLAAADEMGRASRDERSASHWRAHAWANWLRARAAAVPVTSE